MSDYIKREDALKAVNGIREDDLPRNNKIEVCDVLMLVPSADVASVRHGRWEVVDAEEPRKYGCSECKRLSWYMENYCPNCGTKMDEVKDAE